MADLRFYDNRLTAEVNNKGVLDVDVVKGCTSGINAHGLKGCYQACYAASIARFRGIDFSKAVTRGVVSHSHARKIERIVRAAPLDFFRIGTMGDPSHAWKETAEIVEWLSQFKMAVIVTKHWHRASDEQFASLIRSGAVMNTSVSALDTPAQLAHREREMNRYAALGGHSVARVVSCDFDETRPDGVIAERIQSRLLALPGAIDNPLRVSSNHDLVTSGMIKIRKVHDINSVRTISISPYSKTYLGHCSGCQDQCGLHSMTASNVKQEQRQREIF